MITLNSPVASVSPSPAGPAPHTAAAAASHESAGTPIDSTNAPPPNPALFALLLAQRSALEAPSSMAGKARPIHAMDAKVDTDKDGKTEWTERTDGSEQCAASPLFWLAITLPPEGARTLATPTAPANMTATNAGIAAGMAAPEDAKTETTAKPATHPHDVAHAEADLHAELAAFSILAEQKPHAPNNGDGAASTSATQVTVASHFPLPVERPEPPVLTIDSKVGTPGWTRDIRENISLMVQSHTSVAQLKLTPAEMGPIEIRIDFSEKQPSVSILVQQADTRNALDSALPRLREMLAESGVNLGGASVAQQDAKGGHSSAGKQTQDSTPGAHRIEAVPISTNPAARLLAIDQLVDTYA